MNVNMFKGAMRSCGLTQEETAKQIGISVSRFNAKTNNYNGAEFNLADIRALKRVLGLSAEQVDQIFLV
ncbi:helix-turn-helix domain-containing protein [Pseudoflavonifractor phocaeensis]|uniref:helix-turn-helix domain-containing protein n=1 Tax=Pseudoflavonifractor phocaeensis TaxID=1870988 RepID=UPI001F4113CD|nr:helix-turn-helix transcriptional regulator [Pseudoflavonifractor phocaeensis]MCF2662752.1 helix-turn-helix transcriptional regulator [Pseudoflavonifractor phocaeensis]